MVILSIRLGARIGIRCLSVCSAGVGIIRTGITRSVIVRMTMSERPPQTVPYDEDCPAGHCDKPDHAECWSEYDRQENEYKYRPVKGLF